MTCCGYCDDKSSLYEALLDEAIVQAEAYGTALKISAAVDAVLARQNLRPDGGAELRDRLIKHLTDLVEFPCRADLGPTIRCRYMEGHVDEGLPHEPLRWESSDPLTQELAEDMYLLALDPDEGHDPSGCVHCRSADTKGRRGP